MLFEAKKKENVSIYFLSTFKQVKNRLPAVGSFRCSCQSRRWLTTEKTSPDRVSWRRLVYSIVLPLAVTVSGGPTVTAPVANSCWHHRYPRNNDCPIFGDPEERLVTGNLSDLWWVYFQPKFKLI